MTNPTSAVTTCCEWTLSPLFEDIRDDQGLRAWLMRVYFNPTKHSRERYFNALVTKENILEYVSQTEHRFPQTPCSISEVWHILPSLREGLKSVSTNDTAEKGGNYIKGEKTLAEIGKVLGQVPITAAMVNKISDMATQKLSVMLKALGSDNRWLAKEAEEKIDDAKVTTAGIFAEAVMTSGTLSEILDKVARSKLVSVQEASRVVDATEKLAMENLLLVKSEGATREDFIEIFEEDLEKSVNVFNLAQLCVSRQIYPPGKRGRKKAVSDPHGE